MLKAGALYIVVIVSLLIAMISTSLLTIAFYFRLEEQKKVRFDMLMNNLESGTAILLSQGFTSYDQDSSIDLFEEQKDSLLLRKEVWGAYELNMVKAFELRDTIKRAFFSANSFSDPSAIYLADEDRPLSVSGSTQIIGNGELPKAGLKQAYVEGRPYQGKELIRGSIKSSERTLPPLNDALLNNILKELKQVNGDSTEFNEIVNGKLFNVRDSIENSFFNAALIYDLDNTQTALNNKTLKGKIILRTDTILRIAANTQLDQVQIYAQAIFVADGFKGTCQLFARDSIIIGKNCVFDYPSFAGVFKPAESETPGIGGQVKVQAKVSLGEGSHFSGVMLSYEKEISQLQTIISLARGCKIFGEVYATGYVKLEKTVVINGKTYAKRFIMQTPTTLYENYLIDITLNRKQLSKYYLSSPIFKSGQQNQNVLRWLN